MKAKRPIPTVLVSAVLMTILMPGVTSAAIVANFDGGAGNTQVDQYVGIAGNGWTSPWSTNNADMTVTVSNTTPLNSGGNYVTATTTNASARSVKRTYGNHEEVNLAALHVISFDWRFDGNIAQFSANSDRLSIADGSTGGNGESGATAFLIRAHGADRGTATGLQWALYNGGQDNAADIDDNLWVNSGMSFQAGVVYSFKIALDPVSRTYDVTIKDGSTTVTVEDLGFWTSSNTVAGTLNFMSRKSAGADNLAFSFDTVSILVPEPASLSLLGAGAVMMLSRLRRP